MTRSRRLAGPALALVFVLFYWTPLLWWLLRYASHGFARIPSNLPFAILLGRTFKISSIVSCTAVLAAYPVALLWRVSSTGIRRLLIGLMTAPLLLGFIARNYSWIGMLTSPDPLTSLGWSLVGGSALLYTEIAVELVMAAAFIPIAFFLLVQGVAAVTQDNVDAARTLGASDIAVLSFVVIPQSLRAAVLALGMIFTMSLGWFITPRMLGGGKFDFVSNAVLTLVDLGLFSDASNLALYFLMATAIPTLAVTLFAVRRRRLVTGR